MFSQTHDKPRFRLSFSVFFSAGNKALGFGVVTIIQALGEVFSEDGETTGYGDNILAIRFVFILLRDRQIRPHAGHFVIASREERYGIHLTESLLETPCTK